MFRVIKDIFKKTEAAMVIQQLFGHYTQSGYLEISVSPAIMANKIIQQAWDFKPDLLGGRFGQRPHKLTIAAFSIAFSLISKHNDFPEIDQTKIKHISLLALTTIMAELETNGRLYGLTDTDFFTLEIAIKMAAPFLACE